MNFKFFYRLHTKYVFILMNYLYAYILSLFLSPCISLTILLLLCVLLLHMPIDSHGGEELLKTLTAAGLECVNTITPSLRFNPLVSRNSTCLFSVRVPVSLTILNLTPLPKVGKSTAELHMHFNELDDNTCTIVEFRRSQGQSSIDEPYCNAFFGFV